MHRTVADDPRVGREQVFVSIDYLSEMRRTGLFFTFENKFDVERRVMFCARNASKAVRIAMTPALSSEAERAYSRHSN